AHHAVKACTASARHHHARHSQRHSADCAAHQPHPDAPLLRWTLHGFTPCGAPAPCLSLSVFSLSFFSLSFFSCTNPLTFPSSPRPPSPLSAPSWSMRIGPRISTTHSSLGSADRMNMPCCSPLTSFTITSVDSPVFFSRSRTRDVHSLVSNVCLSFSTSSGEYSPSFSKS